MYEAESDTMLLRFAERFGLTRLAYIFYGLLVVSMFVFIFLSSKHITVQLGNRTVSYFTFAPTVHDVVREFGINEKIGLQKPPASLTEGETMSFYTVSKDLSTKVTNGMVVQIQQNQVKKIIEAVNVCAPHQREWDIFLESGKERVIDPGKSGLTKNTCLIFYRDGVVVSEQLIESRIVVSPRPRVIAYGSYEIVARHFKMRSGRPVKFMSTAYSYTGCRTAIGAKARRGIVAVDPKIIRLGTRMYIEGYGYAVAADTGGAIKGKIIDVFLDTRQDAIRWGRRQVNIYIYDDHVKI